MPQPRVLKAGFIYLTCQGCTCGNRFTIDEINGPLGIFCKDCGSSFEAKMLYRIRDALQHDVFLRKVKAAGFMPVARQRAEESLPAT